MIKKFTVNRSSWKLLFLNENAESFHNAWLSYFAGFTGEVSEVHRKGTGDGLGGRGRETGKPGVRSVAILLQLGMLWRGDQGQSSLSSFSRALS